MFGFCVLTFFSILYRTCFYALCLISKTPQGATVLLEANWTAVRHTLEEKWPLAIDPNLEFSDEPVFTTMAELSLPPYIKAPQRVFSYKDFSAVKTTLPGKVAALGIEQSDEGGTKIESNPTKLRAFRAGHLQLRKSASANADIILGDQTHPRQKGSMKRMSRRQLVSGSVLSNDRRCRNRSRLNGLIQRGRPRSLNVETLIDSPDERKV